ncbi:Zn(II)2Cys6 transcription factor [Usnea florida]
MESSSRQPARIKKRTPNACNRCRQQKTKCSGAAPCEQCRRKNLPCDFNSEHQKVLVTREFLSSLKRQARVSDHRSSLEPEQDRVDPALSTDGTYGSYVQGEIGVGRPPTLTTSAIPIASIESALSDSELDSRRESLATDEYLTNPLVSGRSAYVADLTGQPSYLGTTSNWSFGRRILSNAHERVYGTPLPAASLLFEGHTYDLGWDGRRASAEFDDTTLPTSDFALFLINAVKFHCGQLFHLFDEQDFMRNFSNYHDRGHRDDCSDLWHIHYLLVLALGKAFVVRVGQDRRPPGADLYVQAMKLLPDTTYLCKDPIPSMEILCCAALYLQCLDMRSTAYSLIGQALRMAVAHGIHTDIQSRHHSEPVTERCREVWWTVYVLDCHLSSLMGTPLALAEQDISAQLPSFAGFSQKSLALSIHVRLAKTTTLILRTVYGEEGRMDRRFLASIKNALKCLASVNDERNKGFPLNLKNSLSSISRLSAYLHLFHHQCIILTIRPLLYALWEKKVEMSAPVHVSSTGSVRSLLRVCIASAHETMKILAALQAQSLLESFIPFDLESTWSCAVVLLVTKMIDPSLLRRNESWLEQTHLILDEMVSRGNLIAGLRKAELQQLGDTLTKLHNTSTSLITPQTSVMQSFEGDHMGGEGVREMGSVPSQVQFEPLQDWNSEEGLSGDQLIAVADSLDFTNLDWFSATPLG